MERNNLGTMKFKLLLGALFLSLSLSAQVKPGIEVLRERGLTASREKESAL